MDLETVLLAHGKRYPKMQPTDAVKLLYQNEFGGGHLIREEASCLAFLRREYDAVPRDPQGVLAEAIGNGRIRVYLSALPPQDLDRLGDAFLRSAAVRTGTMDAFKEKLSLLRTLTAREQMPFSSEALEIYLKDYAQAGFPMVSHSETYRQAYRPAYRVVDTAIFSELFQRMP